MSNLGKTFTIVADGALLAGCATTPVLEQRLGQILPDDASASYDAGSDTVTLSEGGASVVLANNGTFSTSGICQSATGNTLLLYKTTASGKGKVFTLASEDSDLGIVGAIASRDAEVTVPTSGTAAFNGAYEALIVQASDKSVATGIEGTTCLTANFGASSISGSLINRTVGLADIVIPTTPLSAGGVFSGTVTGGELPGETASNGQVAGMFADVGAGEIVGVLQLDHTVGGDAYYEVGGFTTVAGVGVCP